LEDLPSESFKNRLSTILRLY